MWRAFNPLSCLLLVAVASKAAPTGDEAGRLSQARSFPPPPCRTWEHLPVCTWFCAPSCLHLIGDTLCAGDTEGSLGRDRVLDLGEKIDLGCEARCPQHQLVQGDPRHLLQLCCTGWQTDRTQKSTNIVVDSYNFIQLAKYIIAYFVSRSRPGSLPTKRLAARCIFQIRRHFEHFFWQSDKTFCRLRCNGSQVLLPAIEVHIVWGTCDGILDNY